MDRKGGWAAGTLGPHGRYLRGRPCRSAGASDRSDNHRPRAARRGRGICSGSRSARGAERSGDRDVVGPGSARGSDASGCGVDPREAIHPRSVRARDRRRVGSALWGRTEARPAPPPSPSTGPAPQRPLRRCGGPACSRPSGKRPAAAGGPSEAFPRVRRALTPSVCRLPRGDGRHVSSAGQQPLHPSAGGVDWRLVPLTGFLKNLGQQCPQTHHS